MAQGEGPALQEPKDRVEGPAEEGVEGVQELDLRLQAVEGEAATGQVQIHAQEPCRHPGEALGVPIVPGQDTVLLDAKAPGAGLLANVVRVGAQLLSRQVWVGDSQSH